MSADETNLSEERFADWLAACDAALAAGTAPPTPNEVELSPEVRERMERGLEGLRLLDCLRLTHLSHNDRLHNKPQETTTKAENDATETAPPLPWTRLGRFQLRRELGRGGCGIVYLAYDPVLDREVALKVPHLAAAISPAMRERFLREARAASGLDHPNIVSVHEAGEIGPVCYLVSAYCPGPTLADWLRRHPPVPFPEVAPLMASLADALAHAHGRGVVHRDLKPANILLLPNPKSETRGSKSEIRNPKSESRTAKDPASGPTVSEISNFEFRISNLEPRISDFCPKITDFGLAKFLDSGTAGPTCSGMILGTVSYMAPEQAGGKLHAIGPAADVYALGAILYELLAGRPPFQGESDLETLRSVESEEPIPPARLKSRVPRDLETVCLKCLRKEPHRRYAGAAGLAQDLRRFQENRPILARRPSRAEVAWRWCRRNPAVSLLAASILTLLLAASVGSLIAADRFRVQRNQVLDAEREKTKELVRSLVAQVRAGRQSGLPGRRFNSLETLAKAVQLRSELGEPDDVPTVKEMRDEMIGCLVLADMHPTDHWQRYPVGSWRLAFDGDFQRYVRADRRGMVRVARVEDDQELALFTEVVGKSDPRFLRLSPDGRYVALMRWGDGSVRVWNVDTGEKLNLDVNMVTDTSVLAFDALSRSLAVGHPDGTVSLHDLPTQRFVRRLSNAGRPSVGHIEFDPSGHRLAVSRINQTVVEILNVELNKVEQRLSHSGPPVHLAWSDDGKRLAVPWDPSGITIWDVASWRIESNLPGHQANGGVRAAFQPGSDLLASTGWDDYLRLWHVPSGREVFRMTSKVNSEAFGFSRDGQKLAGKIDGDEISFWQIAPGKEYRSLRSVEGWTAINGARGGAISPDGRLLALVSLHGVHFWDLRSGQDVALLPSGPTLAVAFAPQGDAIYVYGWRGLYRWPMAVTPESPGRMGLGPPEKIPLEWGESLSISADGRRLAAAIRNQGAKVLRLDQPRVAVPLLPHFNTLQIALSPNGRWVAVATQHGDGVKVWDIADNHRTRNLFQEYTTNGVAFSPDSQWFVAGAPDQYRFWRTDPWQEGIRVPRDCGFVPGPVAFSPDSRMAALETAHARISLIDPETGEEFARLEDPNGHRPDWMEFTPDGSCLVTASSRPGAVHVWELHLLRAQLAEAGLDRGLPPWPAPGETAAKPAAWEFSFKLDADARSWRGDVAYDRLEFAQAVADYLEVLRQQPHHAATCNNLAWVYVMAPPPFRKPCEALSLALSAVRQNSSYDRLNTLGVAYYRLERWQEAIDALDKSAKAQKPNGSRGATPWDAFFLAMCHHRLGHGAEARRFYEQGIALRASSSPFRPREQAELDEIQAEAKIVLSQPRR